MNLLRRPASQTLSKVLDISSATTRVASELLKSHAILSDTTVRLFAVDREDLNQYWKSKRWGDKQGYYPQDF